MKPQKISHIVIMGDSLSDRGSMYNRWLFGFIPMRQVAGLQGISPDGRFTNGYVWSDYLSTMIVDEFMIDELLDKRHFDSTAIADAVIQQDLDSRALIHDSFQLNNDRTVDYKGQNLVRSFDEGGLTSYDYRWQPSKSMTRFCARMILSTLSEMRQRLLSDDDAREVSIQHKKETLVIEWSGANDLITVNARPSRIEVEHAVKARIENVNILLKKGYRHFILFNLPDLSLTPRYQSKSQSDRNEAQNCSFYFNDILKDAGQKLAVHYPHCSIEIFDVNHVFTEIFQHPEQYGFDPNKRMIPYISSPDFKLMSEHISPARGYMFYDDMHPASNLHALLAEFFYRKYQVEYHFMPPFFEPIHPEVLNISQDELLASFRSLYSSVLRANQSSFFGVFTRSHLDYKNASLEDILYHGLYGGGHRTFAVLKELQWFDSKGNINLNIPVLKVALKMVETKHDQNYKAAFS